MRVFLLLLLKRLPLLSCLVVGLSSAEGARRELTATADDVLPAISNEHLYTFFFANSAPPQQRSSSRGSPREEPPIGATAIQ